MAAQPAQPLNQKSWKIGLPDCLAFSLAAFKSRSHLISAIPCPPFAAKRREIINKATPQTAEAKPKLESISRKARKSRQGNLLILVLNRNAWPFFTAFADSLSGRFIF
jgi:hypothetical protein